MENPQQKINVLLLGSGGREHAIAWKLKQSPLLGELICVPGSNALEALSTCYKQTSQTDFKAIEEIAHQHKVSIIFPGAEVALVAGLADYFEASANSSHIFIAGPSKAAAQLEGSKHFSKELMQQKGIPTAAYKTFTAKEYEQAKDYIAQHPLPIVLKADGLAAGKGVIIAQSQEEAQTALAEMLLEGKFGESSAKVVIEEFMEGIESSFFALCNGTDYCILPQAKDYKRIGEGDTGLNTGGMGAISPVPFASPIYAQKVVERILEPTLEAMQEAGTAFKGILFIGLMNRNGEPFVVEFNVRLGDPETQAILPLLSDDLLAQLLLMKDGNLGKKWLNTYEGYACTVILASQGYPEEFKKGEPISHIEALLSTEKEETLVFHAGTVQKEEGLWFSNGGRVLALSSVAPTLPLAIEKSMKKAEEIHWDSKYFRRDIGKDVLQFV